MAHDTSPGQPHALGAGRVSASGAAPTAAATDLDALVRARRDALGEGYPPAPASASTPARDGSPSTAQRIWALALSGGGIRSATFCLGLISALAKGDALRRIDVMSTVSGGGYIGAFLGRLFTRLTSSAQFQEQAMVMDPARGVEIAKAEAARKVTEQTREVQKALANPDGLAFLQWLRANGRYLLPRGAFDRTQAAALYLRNLVAVHLELGLVALVLGAALVGINLWAWTSVASLGLGEDPLVFEWMRLLPGWVPTLVWLALPLLLFAATLLACAYWTLDWHEGRRWPLTVVFLVAMAAAGATLWWWRDALILPDSPHALVLRRVLVWIGIMLLWVGATTGLVNAGVFGLWPWLKRQTPAQVRARVQVARNKLTGGLAWCLRLGLLVALVGALDKLAWAVAFAPIGVASLGAALGAVALVGRALLPLAAGLVPKQLPAQLLTKLAQFAGYAATFVLAAWWMSLVYRVAIGALWGHTALDLSAANLMLCVLGLGCLAYVLLTGNNADFLNASSLHRFYRARLVRSYLGASNEDRLGRKATDAAGPVDGCKLVTEVHDGDDIPLVEYRPHERGGPVHLINVCVNETRNPVGGLFNQDRRGRLMTLAGGGLARTAPGSEGWTQLEHEKAGVLGTWVAVSGAAVAPAMGHISRGGMSALLAFAGLRLGYWWDAVNLASVQRGALAWLKGSKTGLLLRETFSAGLRLDERRWLVSDGGHFENTAAYALLQARAELIVLADCGADPEYFFNDLENLSRKARIDLGAKVCVLGPRAQLSAATLDTLTPDVAQGLARFGSLNDLATRRSCACLGIARIHYKDADPGVLVLVKPNMVPDLPVDLVNFKASNERFPQEPTADQFFAEAQWESYFHLGRHQGLALTNRLLSWLVAHVDDAFEETPQDTVFDRLADGDDRPATATRRTAKPVPIGKPAGDGKAGADCPRTPDDARERDVRINARVPARVARFGVGVTTLGVGALLTVGVSAWQAIESLRQTGAQQVSQRSQALDDLASQWARTLPDPHQPPDPTQLGVLAARVAHHAEVLCAGQWEGWYQESATAQRIARETLHACKVHFAPLQRPAPCNQLIDLSAPRPADSPLGDRPPANCLASLTHRACPDPMYGLYDYRDTAPLRDAHPNNPRALLHARQQATSDSTDAQPLEFAPGCERPLHPLVIR